MTSLILKAPGKIYSKDFLGLDISKIALRLVQSSGMKTAQRLVVIRANYTYQFEGFELNSNKRRRVTSYKQRNENDDNRLREKLFVLVI